MPRATFQNNRIFANGDIKIASYTLIPGGITIEPNRMHPNPISGSFEKVAVNFHNEVPPRVLSATEDVTFPSNETVYLIGGGLNDSVVETFDESGNRAMWLKKGN